MIYSYNKDEIKNSLTLDQVEDFIAELGGEPHRQGEVLLCRTICHGGSSHKLYYYDNTKLFRCYTDCGGEAFDLYQLTQKVKSREEPKVRYTKEGEQYYDDWNLPECIELVAKYFGFSANEISDDFHVDSTANWKILQNYDRISNISLSTQTVELKTYDDAILQNLPRPQITPWLKEGIIQEVMDRRNICFDPKNYGIVIPHYDINGRLIGIRERCLITEEAAIKGKYRPAYLNKQLYNHPLSFNLYNLNNSKDNIKRMKKAFVFEGEKSPMLYASYFGEENDISVACCGSSFIQYQAKLLIEAGAEEIIICYDKQFQKVGDDEFKKLVQNLKNIHKKYGHFVTISFLFDKENLLGYKSSPIDHGPQVFMELFKRRVNLYGDK